MDNDNKTSEQKLSELLEWAEEIPSWLSNREGYPRGYRDGIIMAKEIVKSIITGEPIED